MARGDVPRSVRVAGACVGDIGWLGSIARLQPVTNCNDALGALRGWVVHRWTDARHVGIRIGIDG
jgi:hypothetical protein